MNTIAFSIYGLLFYLLLVEDCSLVIKCSSIRVSLKARYFRSRPTRPNKVSLYRYPYKYESI